MGPHHRCLDEAIETGELSTEIEAGEPSSLVRARVMEEAQNGVPKMIDVEGHLSGPNSSVGQGTQVRMGVWTDVCRRESGLKDARVAQRIARTTLLSRDCQLMDALSMSDLIDHSVVNAKSLSEIDCEFNIFRGLVPPNSFEA